MASSAFLSIFVVPRYHIVKNAPPCHLDTGRMRFLGVGGLGCQLGVRSSDSRSFLLEFTYLFIRMIQPDEPTAAVPF